MEDLHTDNNKIVREMFQSLSQSEHLHAFLPAYLYIRFCS